MTVDDKPFRLEEATIEELHQAIKTGRTTCVAVVRHYIERAKAYNGGRERSRHHDRLVRRIGPQHGQALGAATAGVAGLPFHGSLTL